MEKNIQQRADESWENFLEEAEKQIERLNSKSDRISEEAREEITEEPLEIATGKEFSGDRTYMILLGTGGPAMRITGYLDKYGQPKTAEYQFQDWFTEWTTANKSRNDEVLLSYAQQFYFKEDNN